MSASGAKAGEPLSGAVLAAAKAEAADAVRYYLRSAHAGRGEAMVNVALVYSNGELVPRDYAEARKWLERAATSSSAAARTAAQKMLVMLPLMIASEFQPPATYLHP